MKSTTFTLITRSQFLLDFKHSLNQNECTTVEFASALNILASRISHSVLYAVGCFVNSPILFTFLCVIFITSLITMSSESSAPHLLSACHSSDVLGCLHTLQTMVRKVQTCEVPDLSTLVKTVPDNARSRYSSWWRGDFPTEWAYHPAQGRAQRYDAAVAGTCWRWLCPPAGVSAFCSCSDGSGTRSSPGLMWASKRSLDVRVLEPTGSVAAWNVARAREPEPGTQSTHCDHSFRLCASRFHNTAWLTFRSK